MQKNTNARQLSSSAPLTPCLLTMAVSLALFSPHLLAAATAADATADSAANSAT